MSNVISLDQVAFLPYKRVGDNTRQVVDVVNVISRVTGRSDTFEFFFLPPWHIWEFRVDFLMP